MSVLKLIASSSYITVNLTIAEKLGVNESLILGVLCSGSAYCDKHDMTEGGFFPFSIELLQKKTALGRTAQNNALDTLKGVGIIEQKNMGSPPQRYFKINEQLLADFLLSNDDSKCTERAIQNVCDKQFKMHATNNLKCTPHAFLPLEEKNNNKRIVEEEYSEPHEPNIDEQISMTIEAWNSNKHIRATIDRIPFGTKRYDHMMLTIAQFGWERFIEEIRSLDENGFFADWQPGFDWIADPNNFMKLAEGNYRAGKRKETSDNGWTQEERERMERWLAEDDEK